MQTSIKLFSAGGVEIADLANASSVSWQDVFNEAGTGSFSLPYDDPQAAQIVPSTQVYCYLDGLLVFKWIVSEPPKITAVSPDEEGGQEYQVTGDGKVHRLGDARIYPWRGLEPQIVAAHRIYSFASPDFPNLAPWVAASQIALQSYLDPIRFAVIELTNKATAIVGESNPLDPVEILNVPAPLEWKVPNAYWIWGQPYTNVVGFNYFRGTFNIGIETLLVIAATADNYWTLYLDGTPILGEQGEGTGGPGWLEHKRVDLRLAAGTYNLAAVVENIPQEGLPDVNNPAALLVAVFTVDAVKDTLLSTIKISDASWTALAYPASVPGWTPGQILLDCIAEAQARGGLAGFTCAFNGTTDSGGNAWVGSNGSGTYVPGYSAPVGSTVLDVLNDLVSLGWVDYRFNAATDSLQVWSKGTGSVTTGIDFTVTGSVLTQNLVSVEFSPHHPVTSAMFVKWSKGFIEVVNPVAAALYGRVEGFLTVDTDRVDEAIRQANLALDEVDNIEYAIVVEVDPIDPAIDQPYYRFVPGDFVDVLDPAGVLKSTKVYSISIAGDDMGRAAIVLELNNRIKSPDRTVFDLMAVLGRGVVGSTKVTNAAASTSSVGSDT